MRICSSKTEKLCRDLKLHKSRHSRFSINAAEPDKSLLASVENCFWKKDCLNGDTISQSPFCTPHLAALVFMITIACFLLYSKQDWSDFPFGKWIVICRLKNLSVSHFPWKIMSFPVFFIGNLKNYFFKNSCFQWKIVQRFYHSAFFRSQR